MKRYVLDASALMTFFEDRRGAHKVEVLLVEASESKRLLHMSVVNWGEVYYSIWRARGKSAAGEKIRQIAQLPIELIDVNLPSAKLAAGFKAQFGLAYADCFAAVVAHQHKAALVTSDRDFEAIEKAVSVLWVNTD